MSRKEWFNMSNIKNFWFYVRNYKFNSLFLKIFIIISLLLLIPFVLLCIIFYTNTSGMIFDEIMLENTLMLERAKSITDSLINECDTLASSISNNERLQLFMLEEDSQTLPTDVAQFTKTIPLVYKYIDSIYLYSEKNKYVFSNGSPNERINFAELDWLENCSSIIDRRGKILGRLRNGTYPQFISIVKPVYISDQKVGTVALNIDSRILYRMIMLDSNTDENEFFIVDDTGKLLLSKNPDMFLKNASEFDFYKNFSENGIYTVSGNKNIISVSDSNLLSFEYISMRPMTFYEDRLAHIRHLFILVFAGLLLLSFILAYIIASTALSPLKEIISLLESSPVSFGTEPHNNDNELKYIISSINKHIEDKEHVKEILDEHTRILKNTQYNMLQYQINPHFLYNTLETINWMAYDITGSENPVSEALINLANLFRNSISSSEYLISAESEINYTRNYINLLNLRYDDLFEVIWDIDENILHLTVIKICLQPIIENAVTHGLRNRDSGGYIKISASCSDHILHITVTDNGCGIKKETLDKLNEELNSDISSENHIGLKNVNQRIKIIFGSKYGIHLDSEYEKFTSVTITLPEIKWGDNAPKLL